MTHEFALFYKTLSNSLQMNITDTDFVHRVIHVLRMKNGESLVLFNQQCHLSLLLQEVTPKKIFGLVSDFKSNDTYAPHIKLFLPVLKKDAFSEAVYGAVECGVSEIQLVITEKVQRKWQGKIELERLQRVVIAAAEQSKHFAFPLVHEPISFQDALKNPGVKNLLCADPEGEHISGIMKKTSFHHSQQPQEKCEDPGIIQKQSYGIFLGPEGGLTEKELNELKQAQVTFFKLTPTILRARQAAILSVGILRAL